VATFIVQKILLDDVGLAYICATAERFFAVSAVLANMVQMLAEQPSVRLLKHIIRCYLRLSDNPRWPLSSYNVLFNQVLLESLPMKKILKLLLSTYAPILFLPSSFVSYRACEALKNCLPDLLHLDSVCSLTLFPSRCTIMVAAYTWLDVCRTMSQPGGGSHSWWSTW
jgi:hypothetical protein